MDGETVRSLIQYLGALAAGSAYINGEPITQEYIDRLYELRNLDAILEKVSEGYSVSTSRQSLHSMPTNDFAGEDENDYFYDTLVTSEYMPFRLLRVLHESSGGNWYFVMFSGYAGWVDDWLPRLFPRAYNDLSRNGEEPALCYKLTGLICCKT